MYTQKKKQKKNKTKKKGLLCIHKKNMKMIKDVHLMTCSCRIKH